MMTDKKISIIVAVAENHAIGKNNELLWHISDDLKWFKRHTSGNPVIMGKKTWFSLPRRPLPNRMNIVLTDDLKDCFGGCVLVNNIEQVMERMDPVKENFIIGGGSVYRQFLPKAQKLYLTKVHKSYDADTFFPEIDADWKEVFREDHQESPDHPAYSFLIFER